MVHLSSLSSVCTQRTDVLMVHLSSLSSVCTQRTDVLMVHLSSLSSLSSVTGRDATKAFTDVGHSDSARDLKSKYYIGDLSCCDCTTRAVSCIISC